MRQQEKTMVYTGQEERGKTDIRPQEAGQSGVQMSQEVRQQDVRPVQEVEQADVQPVQEIGQADVQPVQGIGQADMQSVQESGQVDMQSVQESGQADMQPQDNEQPGVQLQEEPSQETIRIRYHSDQIEKLAYIDGKSDWIDLRSAENIRLKKGEFRLISLGISMQLPKGYEAVLVPRSSTYKNFGIIQTNHMGVIDETYSGDKDVWRMPVLAMRDTQIQVNDRICQFRIQKHQPRIVFEETDRLGNVNRGGFGSTGRH